MSNIDRKYVYKRKDGRWEARYIKGYGSNGKPVYGSLYGRTKESVIARRNKKLGISTDEQGQSKQNNMNLLILGAGSHGQSVKEIAENLRLFKKIAFLDDNQEGEDVIGKFIDAIKLKSEYPCAFVAIGDNKLRKKYAKYLKESGFLIPNIVSPAAEISKDAIIGEGVAIMPRATISNAEIGDFCILESNSLINFGCKIGECSRIDSGGIVSKGYNLPKETLVKTGEVVK